MSVAKTFERLHKKAPTDADLRRIYEIGSAVGADDNDVFLSLIVAETSPRAGNKRQLTIALGVFGGNIPACGEQTTPFICNAFFLQKHPRVRGTNPSG